jgi:hypothetical protein
LIASLTVIGTPSSGRRSPRASAASACAAATRARSRSRTTTALIAPSCASIRRIDCSSRSIADTSRACSAATVCDVVRNTGNSLRWRRAVVHGARRAVLIGLARRSTNLGLLAGHYS